MKAARGGRIINISSGAGLGISLTGIQAYASAKAAQIGLTRQLAHELGPWGITVNNIAPGFVRSNPTTERQWESYGEEGQRALVDRIALKRLGTPDDIAYGVLFFASEYAGWITRPGDLDRRREVMRRRSSAGASRGANHDRDPRPSSIEFACDPERQHRSRARGGHRPRRQRWVADASCAPPGPFTVRTIATAGNPVVYGEWLGAPGKPTVLVYGHYDVQPPDPLEKWHSPPLDADRARRPPLRPRRVRRQGADADSDRGGRGVLRDRRPPAGQREVHVRGRGGDRQPPSRRHSCSSTRSSSRRTSCVSADGAMWRIDEPSLTVASRGLCRARAHAHGGVEGSAFRAVTAAASRIRCTRWRD